MKLLAPVLPLILLPSTYAWTFTWRNAEGEATTETGHGPHACITINHAKGKVFKLDGEGEKGINMLLYTTPDCSGDSAGMATEFFSKHSSVALHGFKVVSTADEDTTTSETTTTTTRTTTLVSTTKSEETITVTHTTATTSDATETTTTPSSTSTQTSSSVVCQNGTTVSSCSATETAAEPTTSTSTATPTPTPTTGLASTLSPSTGGLLSVVFGAVMGGAAFEWLF